jgi:diaminohydroxyphosphoribosylaminopyrimidine deaminase/5-amino-6-(5-phosphoribosylamino)uracil reductase
MRRALALAECGRGRTSPNPLVGCVIVSGDRLVGEGWHERAGGEHAEVVALRAAGEAARGSTVVVTLEPCNHYGRTPPCTDALLAAGVARVVAAVEDPHPAAAGGAERLRAAGVEVDIGLRRDEAARQNEVFLHGEAAGRPFVVAKAAVSLDGRIAAAEGSSQWLTGPDARAEAHRLRAAVDAVVVGSGTVLADDPQLTVRLPGYNGRQPLRVVLDRRGRVPASGLRICDDAAETLRWDQGLDTLVKELWARGVRSAMVEGGAQVLAAFLQADLVDKLIVHVAPLLLGPDAKPLLDGPWPASLSGARRWRLDSVEHVGADAVLTLYPPGE